MLSTYDKAMVEKIKAWNQNVIYANTAVTYESVFNKADDEQRELKFPLINIYRPTGYELDDTQTFAGRRQGQLFFTGEKDSDRGRFLVVNLMYQFDIYAKSTEKMDQMTLELIQALNAMPMLEVTHESKNGSVKERYEIQYLGGPTEQSEFNSGDRTYRSFVQFQIQGVRLYNYAKNYNVLSTEVEIEILDE